VSQNDGAGAIAALETVPAKARNPRINMALGKLYSARGLERSAITAYKEVLRVGI
jgi:anaphase-promoting complex subunit 7